MTRVICQIGALKAVCKTFLERWISGTYAQACTDLQSLIIRLDYGDIMAQNAVMQGYVGLLKIVCRGYTYSHGK